MQTPNPLSPDLAARAAAGDSAAFGEIYDALARPIYGYLYRKVWDRDLAEDLTSQTFLRALERISTFNPKKGEIRPWLYGIARHLALDHFREAKPNVDLDDVAEMIPGDADLPREVGARRELARVREALRTLSPEQREIVRLRIWEDLGHREIAALLGKSEGSVKVAFSRGIGKIRADLLVFALIPHLAGFAAK